MIHAPHTTQYPAYKDSGVEWIGDIPEGWEVKKLKYVANIRNSSVDRHQYDDELPVKIVHYPDAYKNESITSKYNFVTGTCSKEELSKFQLFQGDVIITKDSEAPSDIGVPCYIADYLENVVCGYHLTIISSNDNTLNGAYLSRFLQFSGSRNYFETQANGITRFGLGQYSIFNFPFPIPPLAEQNAIARYLDEKTAQVDQLVQQSEKIIALLREQRATTINHAVTKGLTHLPPEQGGTLGVPLYPSGVEWIGDVPEGWVVSRLDFITSVNARVGWKALKADEYQESGYIFLSTPNIKGVNIDFNNVNYITEDRYVESPEIMLDLGDVLLAKDGSTLGITNVVRYLPSPATVNSSIAVLKRITEDIDSIFLYYFLSSDFIQNIIQLYKGGMGVPHLYQADIKKFTTIKPPLSQQTAIAQYLDEKTTEIDTLIAQEERRIELLREYRAALISEVVTGKVRVPEIA